MRFVNLWVVATTIGFGCAYDAEVMGEEPLDGLTESGKADGPPMGRLFDNVEDGDWDYAATTITVNGQTLGAGAICNTNFKRYRNIPNSVLKLFVAEGVPGTQYVSREFPIAPRLQDFTQDGFTYRSGGDNRWFDRDETALSLIDEWVYDPAHFPLGLTEEKHLHTMFVRFDAARTQPTQIRYTYSRNDNQEIVVDCEGFALRGRYNAHSDKSGG
jgi:hypothetical protein